MAGGSRRLRGMIGWQLERGCRTEANVLFTVFTPTYNREETLPRLYESLVQQTLNVDAFEWLIVDDGSTDETEKLVRLWMQESRITIRYLRQDHGGKHRAWNLGVAEARGELFAAVDSDDACLPDALATIEKVWSNTDPHERALASGVFAREQDPDGNSIGKPFPKKRMSNRAELFLVFGVIHDIWLIFRTSVLRENLFPAGPSGSLVPEGAIWDKISKCHECLLCDDALYVYYTGPHGRADQLSKRASIRVQAPGMVISLKSLLDNSFRYFAAAPLYFTRGAIHFLRFSLHERLGLPDQIHTLSERGARLLCWAVLPVALLLYVRDLAFVARRQSAQ